MSSSGKKKPSQTSSSTGKSSAATVSGSKTNQQNLQEHNKPDVREAVPAPSRPVPSAKIASGKTSGTSTQNKPTYRTQITSKNKRKVKKTFFEQYGLLSSIVGAIVVVVGIVVIITHLLGSNGSGGSFTSQPAANSVLNELTNIPANVYTSVGAGSVKSPFVKLTGNAIYKDAQSKPVVLYIGAEYCPYCAAMRWGLINALSRFGTFNGLYTMESSATDVFPSTNTFTFLNATYTSKYLDFQSVEYQDRNQNPLQKLTSAQSALFAKYDTSPYTSSTGGIPFFDISNQYIASGSSIDPSILSSLDWAGIAGQLSNTKTSVSLQIIGTANYFTAAFCNVTNQQPAAVCTLPAIQSLETQVNK